MSRYFRVKFGAKGGAKIYAKTHPVLNASNINRPRWPESVEDSADARASVADATSQTYKRLVRETCSEWAEVHVQQVGGS